MLTDGRVVANARPGPGLPGPFFIRPGDRSGTSRHHVTMRRLNIYHRSATLALFVMTACGAGPFFPGLPTGGDQGGSSGSTGYEESSTGLEGQTSVVTAGGSGWGADDATDSSGTSGSSGGSSSSESSTGADSASETGDPVCILPLVGSWCESQLIVAQAIGCSESAEPTWCYETVWAQYDEGDPTTVQAADCNMGEPGCEDAMQECLAQAPVQSCDLYEGDSLGDCEENGLDVGIGVGMANFACLQMLRSF